MIGTEYTGIDNFSIIVEGTIEHIMDYGDHLPQDENTGALYLMAKYQVMNETLDYNFQWIHYAQYLENILKFSVKYDIMDALTMEAGIIFYEVSQDDSPFYSFRDQDRIYTGLKYSF